MSAEAKNWASDQHTGRSLLKLVLLGTCNYVNKRTCKSSAHPQTVAEWCEIPRAQTVSDAQQELAEKGFLVDTGERIGRNGQTIVWTPGWDKHSHPTDTALTTPSGASLTRHSHATDTPLARH